MNKDLNRLQNIAQENFDSRKRKEKLVAWLKVRADEIKEAPWRVKTAYYCDQCKADVEGDGFKQIRMPKDSMWFAFYKGYCPKGHTVIRYITDKLRDPYFWKSPLIKKQRAQFEDLLLTPEHPRFKEVYPQKWAELQLRKQGVTLDV